MAGKTIEESKAQRRKDYKASRGKGTRNSSGGGATRIAVTHTDTNGKAYISYVDPGVLQQTAENPVYANLASINADKVVLSTKDLEYRAFPIYMTPGVDEKHQPG